MGFTEKDEKRFYSKVKKMKNGCWFWLGHRGTNGYGQFRWRANGSDNRFAHRFSYAYHNGEIPKGLCVAHKCDNPGCVNPDHLFLATVQENQADAARKGRKVGNPEGRPVGGGKLSATDVRFIRAWLDSGCSKLRIAGAFNVSTCTILNIARGITHKHI
jgi:hypothetical protein